MPARFWREVLDDKPRPGARLEPERLGRGRIVALLALGVVGVGHLRSGEADGLTPSSEIIGLDAIEGLEVIDEDLFFRMLPPPHPDGLIEDSRLSNPRTLV